jgi:CheY-like chemotaxis protein
LVEDDKSLRGLFKDLLERKGYAVRTASNTEQGIRLFGDFRPFNVVLIDYYTPPNEQTVIDYHSQQSYWVQLAQAIQDCDPDQKMIVVARDFLSASEVPRPAGLRHIPLIVDIGNPFEQLSSHLETIEVHRAYKALTPQEWVRLESYCRLCIVCLGRAALRREWNDLLQQALYRTALGARDSHNGRHWNRKVSFAKHLKRAIESTANLWKRQYKEQNISLMSELVYCDSEGKECSPADDVASTQKPADQLLIEEERWKDFLLSFSDDPDATQLLLGWKSALTKTEIMVASALDNKRYDSAYRRVRVVLLALRKRGKDDGRS